MLWEPNTQQVVGSASVVFNESAMDKDAQQPIELRRVTFANATPPTDGPAMNTRATSQSFASTTPSTAPTITSD